MSDEKSSMRSLIGHPMEWVGCYSLDLYCKYNASCHEYGEFPHNYTGQFGGKCRARAARAGWILHKDGTTTCPKCAKEIRAERASFPKATGAQP